MDLKYDVRYDIVKHFSSEIHNIYRGDDLQKRLIVESCKGKLHALLALLIAESFFINAFGDIIQQAHDQDDEDTEDQLIFAGLNVEDRLKKFASGLVKTTIDHVISTIPDHGYFYERQVNAFFDDLYKHMRLLQDFYADYKHPLED